MPQTSIDYSQGAEFERRKLGAEINSLIASTVDNCRISDCKTRFRRVEEVVVGVDTESHAQVYVGIQLLSGRSSQTKRALGEQVLAALREHVDAAPGHRLHLAVHVTDLDRDAYCRHSG